MTTTGCAQIREELYYPNGFTGHELDRHSINVSGSKQFQLVRAAVVFAMASRMATATIHDGRDADAVADYLAAASDELNYSAADIFSVTAGSQIACFKLAGDTPIASDAVDAIDPSNVNSDHEVAPDPKPVRARKAKKRVKAVKAPAPAPAANNNKAGCTGYVQNFESDLPLLEGRIVNVMIAALPQEQSRKFLDAVRKGDILGASFAAVRTVFQSAVGLDRSAGVFRSGLELFASSADCTAKFDAKSGTVSDAARCLGIPSADPRHPPAQVSFDAATENANARYALTALMAIARASCLRMPLPSDEAISDAVSRRNDACNKLTFGPKERPQQIEITASDQKSGETDAGKGGKNAKAGK